MSASSSAYVDATAGAVEHCEVMAQAHPDLAEHYYKAIASFCQDKLWHQLTVRILELVQDPKAARTCDGVHSYLALYDKVVLKVDSKLHPLSLARIAAAVASALTDPVAAKAVLENLLAKEESLGTAATIFVQSKLSLLTLQQQQQQQQPSKEALAAILQTIRTNAATLHEISMSEQPIVHAAHYEQAMTYYKVVGPPEAFYEQAMAYLRYNNDAPPGGNPQLAVDLCLAALTGDGVYNLNQVLQQQALLQEQLPAESKWLVELLQACADGAVTTFQQLTQQHAVQIQAQPALVHRAAAVQEKLSLLALVRTAFGKDAHERTLTFDELAASLHVPLEHVEMLIMRALSVGLIKGSMDQVDGTVQVTWVLPRSLNTTQLEALATRYGDWAEKVRTTKESVQEQTPTFA